MTPANWQDLRDYITGITQRLEEWEVDKIGPCPFCGSEDGYLRKDGPAEGMKRFVYCDLCHASGPWARSPEGAVDNWNDSQNENTKLKRQLAKAVEIIGKSHLVGDCPSFYGLADSTTKGLACGDCDICWQQALGAIE